MNISARRSGLPHKLVVVAWLVIAVAFSGCASSWHPKPEEPNSKPGPEGDLIVGGPTRGCEGGQASIC
jgi:hypothetical protein